MTEIILQLPTTETDAAAYDAIHGAADEVGLCVERALAVLDIVRHSIEATPIANLAQHTMCGAFGSIRTELERIDALICGEPTP